MSSENVELRKHMSSEQERWRALERSRAKQDERRRTEMEQKCDDIHALRYRLDDVADVFFFFLFWSYSPQHVRRLPLELAIFQASCMLRRNRRDFTSSRSWRKGGL